MATAVRSAVCIAVVLLIVSAPISADTAQCNFCKGAIEVAGNLVDTFGPKLLTDVEPICVILAPFLPGLIHMDYCDPKIPNECLDLCVGMIRSWGPVLVDVYSALEFNPSTSCARMGVCPIPSNASIPAVYPKPHLVSSGKPGSGTSSIFQVTDIHYDRQYQVGAITDCEMPVCCHKQFGSGDAAEFGDFSCDTPEVMVKSVFSQLSVHQPDFLVYTGDGPAHDLWEQTHATNVGAIANITRWVAEALPNATMFIPALGNHAAAPVDNFGGPGVDYWLYGPVGDLWAPYMPRDAQVSFRWSGYYTKVMEPGLRAIVLHTNMYDCDNQYMKLYTGTPHWDLGGQMAWFEDVLGQIEALGEKAYVFGHEAPTAICGPEVKATMWRLFSRYRSVIVAGIFGHVHTDFFNLMYQPSNSSGSGSSGSDGQEEEEEEEAMAMLYMAPSVTPWHNDTNPSYRVYTASRGADKTLLDYSQYRTYLARGNQRGFLTWTLGYSARSGYNIPDLSLKSWAAAGAQVGSNVTAWQFFRSVYHGGLVLPQQNDNQTASMCILLRGSKACQ